VEPTLFLTILLVLGLVSGFLAALSSTSPSLILIPILTVLYSLQSYSEELPAKLAIVNSLATTSAVFATCTFRHHRLGHFQEGSALLLFCGAILGAIVGVGLAPSLNTPLILGIIAIGLIVVGLTVVQRPDGYAEIFKKLAIPTRSRKGILGKLELFAIGLSSGVFSSATGIGSGLVAIPLQFMFGMPVLAAIHNASLATSFSSFTALMGYLFFDSKLSPMFNEMGLKELFHLSALVSGGMVGARLGVSAANSRFQHRFRFLIGPLYVSVGIAILSQGHFLLSE